MSEEMKLVPVRVLKMITSEGFIQAYHKARGLHMTNYDAYESCEEDYEKHFGKRKYSEFQSFKQILIRKKQRP